MNAMKYAEARRDPADFRQYLALRTASARARGGCSPSEADHLSRCQRELARLVSLPLSAIRDDLAIDVATIEALELLDGEGS